MNICKKCGKMIQSYFPEQQCRCHSSSATDSAFPISISEHYANNIEDDATDLRLGKGVNEMNEYQEALDELKEFSSKGFGSLIKASGSQKDVEDYKDTLRILQQAVDNANKYEEKETPIEVKNNRCPECASWISDKPNYCSYCGTRLEFKNE